MVPFFEKKRIATASFAPTTPLHIYVVFFLTSLLFNILFFCSLSSLNFWHFQIHGDLQQKTLDAKIREHKFQTYNIETIVHNIINFYRLYTFNVNSKWSFFVPQSSCHCFLLPFFFCLRTNKYENHRGYLKSISATERKMKQWSFKSYENSKNYYLDDGKQ